MAKIQNISEIHPTLGFTEFDILEKYRKNFKNPFFGGTTQNKARYAHGIKRIINGN